MARITSIEGLEALYGPASEAARAKVSDRLTPAYRRLLEAAPFMAVATASEGGADCSPRGDADQVAFVIDDRTLAIPDRRGNNRLDTLRNIVRDPHVGLLFLVPGCDETLRVNGRAHLTTDADLLERYTVARKAPACVIVVEIDEVYFQCARAVMRSQLWTRRVDRTTLPSAGEMVRSAWDVFDAADYDAKLPERQKETLY